MNGGGFWVVFVDKVLHQPVFWHNEILKAEYTVKNGGSFNLVLETGAASLSHPCGRITVRQKAS